MTASMELFPSPYGDFVFQPDVRRAEPLRVPAGFRPLTGILFFNLDPVLIRDLIKAVSVPLRGFCFSTF